MLSVTDLKIMEELSTGEKAVLEIAYALNKDKSQIYRRIDILENRGFLEKIGKFVSPTHTTITNYLIRILAEFPNIKSILAGGGISILISVLTPKTIVEITQKTGFSKSMVYLILNRARRISVVKKQNSKYIFNEQIWPQLKEFLIEYKKYEEALDTRVPTQSIIYYKTKDEIVYSTKSPQNAALTGFSAFEQYGIKLLSPIDYYYLPKQKLSKNQVFIHALYITEKEKSVRGIIYCALFYLKFKESLKKVKHPILRNIKRILEGERIEKYPSLEEIKEKAEIYDIKV